MKVEINVYWIGSLELLADGRITGMFEANWLTSEPYAYSELGTVPKTLEAAGEGCFTADVSGEKGEYQVGFGISELFREWSDTLGTEIDFEAISQAIYLVLENNPTHDIHPEICAVFGKWKQIQVNKLKEQEKIERGVQRVLRTSVVEAERRERF